MAYIRGDEFAGSALDTGLWTFEEGGIGDCSVSVSGGQLNIVVPSGTAHDIWSDGIAGPRITQPIDDSDLQVVVKFDSAMAEQYEGQGLLFFQDADDLIRIDTNHDGTTQKVFAATFVAGSPTAQINTAISATTPIYLRVSRTGNTWTFDYSANGIAWTNAGSFSHTLTVTKFGVFGLNAGGPAPAHTALVDWVRPIPTVRSTGAATLGTTTTSVTVTKPAGTVSGDLLLAVVTNGGANAAPSTVPSGWALRTSIGGTTWWGGVYYKTAGGSEPADYTWSGFTNSCTACMVCVVGADSSPFDVSNAQANTSGNVACAGVTTTVATLLLALAAVDDNQALSAWACATDPTSLAEKIEQLSSGGVDTGVGIAAAAKVLPGATGALSATLATSSANSGFLVAVKSPQPTAAVPARPPRPWQPIHRASFW